MIGGATMSKPISPRMAHLFGLRWVLGRECEDPCDDWGVELPEGLFYHKGVISYECGACGEWTEWPVEPELFELGDPHNVCGRSPRCCP